MARNLLNLIETEAGSGLADRIAQAVGVSPGTVRTGLAAAIPAILSALISFVSRPGGADTLANALRKQDPGIPDNPASVLGGANQQGTIDAGKGLLSSLLGDGTVGNLTNAIGSVSGVDRGAAGSLLGIAAPLVMGVLRREQRNTGGSPGDLAALLTSQKDSVAAALPAGLTGLLGGTGVLDGIADRLGAGASATARAGRAAANDVAGATSEAARRAAPRSSWLRNVAILVALLVAAAIIYAIAARGPSVPDLTVDGVDLGKEVTGVLDTATSTLQGVTDEASASAALPKLQEVSTKLDGLVNSAGQLPAAAKTALGGIVSAALPALRQLADKVLEIPGVATQLKPVIDEITTKLASLAT